MADTLPMLRNDPRRNFRTSRMLRVGLFSLVAATVIVSILIVLVRFVWDNFVATLLNQAPYNANPLLVLPAMAIIAALLAKVLWENAEGRPPRSK